jgi:hypothetical protein
MTGSTRWDNSLEFTCEPRKPISHIAVARCKEYYESDICLECGEGKWRESRLVYGRQWVSVGFW